MIRRGRGSDRFDSVSSRGDLCTPGPTRRVSLSAVSSRPTSRSSSGSPMTTAGRSRLFEPGDGGVEDIVTGPQVLPAAAAALALLLELDGWRWRVVSRATGCHSVASLELGDASAMH